MKAAAAEVLPDAVLVASEQRAVPAEGSRLVTTLTRHPGGAAVQVHARIGESFTLVYDALVSRGRRSGGAAGRGRCRHALRPDVRGIGCRTGRARGR